MESLQGSMLIAMPSLDDTFFERSVIYICKHNEKGAMGLVINRPVGIDVQNLLEQMELNPAPEVAFNLSSQVVMGGPVSTERGYVLHSPQTGWSNSFQVSDFCMLTSSRDVLASLGSDNSPQDYIVALGYAGWRKDQLEQELTDNTWLTIKATPELLYHIDHDDLWQQATKALGFDIWQLTTQAGHA
ncbi:YqgE/AlgH family protein [Shewanella intestini]|uniref:UPF0301 protein G3R48_09520 n=1 Tax=Shewanella intestini TaxID=2017544 RepID=A0ABS5I4C2_9GAMM|nr:MULTISPECIES: YqgE/AlgH family protein [Shewanella]MBR9728215.1 YqgE/AlgH family protein [Shewanella intestini]MRG35680.1 YqgE/AlgH family protein [Shewanella sp. XMDDZSB0408]